MWSIDKAEKWVLFLILSSELIIVETFNSSLLMVYDIINNCEKKSKYCFCSQVYILGVWLLDMVL